MRKISPFSLLLFAGLAIRLTAQTVEATGTAATASPPPVAKTFEITPEVERACTLVVFNTNDPESEELAKYYREKRGIPEENMIGLPCNTNEQITRAQYEKTLEQPLIEKLEKGGFWTVEREKGKKPRLTMNRIRYVALMRGIPLKIAPEPTLVEPEATGPEALKTHNEAAVDSELSILGTFLKTRAGAVLNPYYKKGDMRIFNPMLSEMMLVCRLDAPNATIVRHMIDDSLAAEATGLEGMCYADARGIADPGYAEGDKFVTGAAAAMEEAGVPVYVDHVEAVFPKEFPLTRAAFYFGWYTNNIVGPFAEKGFRFVPGAVAMHLQSFSAYTLREENAAWCGPLLARGAAATVGNVYEPYLTFTPNFDVLAQQLAKGNTFAESAYSSIKILSWMTTFIGDPLYRPCAKWNAAFEPNAPLNEWSAYRVGAKAWFTQGHERGAEILVDAGNKLKSGVIFEGLGLLESVDDQHDAASGHWKTAWKYYTTEQDKLRLLLEKVQDLREQDKKPEAIKMVKGAIASAKDAKGTTMGMLVRVLEELEPPKPTPPPGASAPGNGKAAGKTP